jgi:hypothetical protein
MITLSRTILASVILASLSATAGDKVECICVYYPHWHRYPKGDEWFGADNWKQGEWAFVKDARRLYPNHKQPMVPYAGYLDGSDPEDMAKEIALAANAGIDVFLYDYYWYDGKVTQEEALERGFLGAKNRSRMKFALMWCYHHRDFGWRVKIGEPRRRLMALAHTKEEFLGLIRYSAEHYFNKPEYWRKDGRIFFSIYDAPYFCSKRGNDAGRIKAELDEAREIVRAAGLGELHFNAQMASPRLADFMADCGFDSLTDYNTNPYHMPAETTSAMRAKGEWEIDYRASFPTVRRRWQEMSSKKLPYIPNVTTGWDSTPRCRLDEPYPWRILAYPYTMSFTNNTPEAFREILSEAKAHAENDPKKPGAVYINGWNEYTEGTYLVPNNFDSDGFLRAVAAVFGRHPSDEYTYVNPSDKALYTVPAAKFENVAYGPHSKQKIDVFIPKGESGPFPTVVYIHGGNGNDGVIVDDILGSSLRQLLDSGIAVVAVGYRYLSDMELDGGGISPEQVRVNDCEAAMRFLGKHAAEYGIDMSCLVVADKPCSKLAFTNTISKFQPKGKEPQK